MTCRIESSDIKSNRSYFPTRKSDRQGKCLLDDGCIRTVEEFESNRGNSESSEMVPGNESWVHKTMGRSRIQESTDDTFWQVLRSKGECKRVRVRKSGRVENHMSRGTNKFNATFGSC